MLLWLYLKRVWTGDFQEALEVLLGKDAQALSANTISPLEKGSWKDEQRRWRRRVVPKNLRQRFLKF